MVSGGVGVRPCNISLRRCKFSYYTFDTLSTLRYPILISNNAKHIINSRMYSFSMHILNYKSSQGGSKGNFASTCKWELYNRCVHRKMSSTSETCSCLTITSWNLHILMKKSNISVYRYILLTLNRLCNFMFHIISKCN